MQRSARLIINEGETTEEVYPFTEQIVIGRKRPSALLTEGYVRIRDPAVSGRHCVVRQADDGRFFVRDESRNGTRLDSRRLIPNVEVEIRDGAVIEVGGKKVKLTLRVETEAAPKLAEDLDDDINVRVAQDFLRVLGHEFGVVEETPLGQVLLQDRC